VTAEAELTLADLPEEFAVPSDLEALGWRVYAGEPAANEETGHA
jgi:hypothetical protein